ncbi:MAG: chromosome segregation protein SMC [Bacillota bacterium]
MYLKRIELAGFKSFADRTQLELGPGITAVVGPNGSGKSNVADAIRWVLGEQSAKSLRGAKMEEVIFAGSDKRRSVGMAEVSLTLDNEDHGLPLDYREITVTRRLFRTGDSEYSLNGNTCRLKDIVELFMDTGVGKEAYSIIGQGKIDEVLNAKPEDRRALFEEAAGISKHKHRKREAMRKLDDVYEQLMRLQDIMRELSRQIGPLKEQAAQAEAYLSCKEALKDAELQLFDLDLGELRSKRKASAIEAEKATDALSQGQAELSGVEARLTERRWRLARVSETMEQMTQDLLALVNRLEHQNGQLSVYAERERSLQEQVAQANSQSTLLDEKIAQLRGKLEELRSSIAQLTAARQEAAATLANRQGLLQEWEQAEQDGALRSASLQEDLLKLIEKAAALESLCQRVGESLRTLGEQQHQLLSEQEEQIAVMNRTDLAIHEAQMRAEALQQKASGEENALGALHTRLNKERQALAEHEKRLSVLNAAQASTQSRLRTLTAMERSLDGYQRGVKAVLQTKREQPGRLPGVIDTVASLIKVPAHLEVAVEIALGGALQNIVAEDEEAARLAIDYLKQTHSGRATFLPMSVVRGRRAMDAAERISAMPGWIGVAAALVIVEQRYQPIVDHLLGQVMLMENLPTALAAARVLGHRYRIVTLGGDVLYPGGSMTGGSVGRRETTILGRGREREEAVSELAELAQQKAECIRMQQQHLQAVTELAASVQTLEHELSLTRQDIRDQDGKLTAYQRELTQLQEQGKRLEHQLSLNDLRHSEMEQELAARNRQLDQTLQERKRLDHELARLRLDDGNRREQRRSLDEAIAESRWRTELQSRQLDEAQRELARLELEMKQHQESCAQYQAAIVQWQQQIERLLATCLEVEGELAELSRSRADTEENLDSLRKERSALATEIAAEEQQIGEIRKRVDQLRETQYGHQVRLARMESELQGLSERLWADYQLTDEALQQMMTDRPHRGRRALVERSSSLRQEIRAMGLVNLGAIEELARVEERLTFLSAQEADMDATRQGLLQVIDEMEQVMTQRFAETFRAVNRSFGQVFMELFGGGSAEIVLTDPEQILSSGVEITAQPPGKKPSGLAMLSGGERALTAIALLFAILRWRPTPFCVLDEIEASLDESNVSRLASCLKEYAKKSQFVVITHRKGTMEVADLLIGVTMQSLGVSSVMNLRLANAEAAAGVEDSIKVD